MKQFIESRGHEIFLHSEVYKPREDSFMMIDGILEMKDIGKDPFVEVGSGTGIVSFAIKYSREVTSIAIDVNYDSAKLTHENAKHNMQTNTLVVCSDLLKPFRKDSKINHYLFNPPYLPEDPSIDPLTPKYEKQQLVGGTKGYETLIEMISYLDPNSDTCYVIISSLSTNPVEFSKMLSEWTCRVIRTENMGFETIWLVRLGDEK